MRPTIDQIRRDTGIRYGQIAKRLPGVKLRQLSKFFRGTLNYGQWNWLVAAAVLEVMNEISPLQTDIEDFCDLPVVAKKSRTRNALRRLSAADSR